MRHPQHNAHMWAWHGQDCRVHKCGFYMDRIAGPYVGLAWTGKPEHIFGFGMDRITVCTYVGLEWTG
jgi:hypothetical protein